LQTSELLIGQQGRTLTILADNLATGEGVASKKTRHADRKREDEQEATDGEGEDPLELEEVRACEELADAGCCG
jgi:hypothetical protein